MCSSLQMLPLLRAVLHNLHNLGHITVIPIGLLLTLSIGERDLRPPLDVDNKKQICAAAAKITSIVHVSIQSVLSLSAF